MKTRLFISLIVVGVIACNHSAISQSPESREHEQHDTRGRVTATDGRPLEGVIVSDGFSCSRTNADGIYFFNRDSTAFHVYYTIPAAYRVEIDATTDRPCFYQLLEAGKNDYDFVLRPLGDGPERAFNLVCIADPQVKNEANLLRFKNETVDDLLHHAAGITGPRYGITLGDIIADVPSLIPGIADAMTVHATGMPLFQTIGNHDHWYPAANEIESQRNFERAFGPLNYSFDRGDAHVVVMDDVLHLLGSSSNYNAGFTPAQYKWLQADLSFVPRDKLVIFCTRIPFRGGSASGGATVNTNAYHREVLELLAAYNEAHVMVGHTHDNNNYIHDINGKKIHEHVHGTACGAWWNSTICKDGTPNGYAVYRVDGTSIVNAYYKPTRYPTSFQIRLYRGNTLFSGGHATSRWQFSRAGAGQIIANIWNADPGWTVRVHEDGIPTGTMTRYTDVECWASAYHVGAKGRSTSYVTSTDHLFYYTLRGNPTTIRVEAVDSFGNTYFQEQFTGAAAADYPDKY